MWLLLLLFLLLSFAGLSLLKSLFNLQLEAFGHRRLLDCGLFQVLGPVQDLPVELQGLEFKPVIKTTFIRDVGQSCPFRGSQLCCRPIWQILESKEQNKKQLRRRRLSLLQLVHLFGLQVGAALYGGGSAPLFGHQVRGVRLGELGVVALYWGRP